MKKVVIDTNVFISGLLHGRVTRRIILALIERKFKLLTSIYIFNELIHVSKEQRLSKIIEADTLTELTNLIIEEAEFASPRRKVSLCRDPKDNPILECALEGADIIVTGDKDLLVLNPFHKISIVTPKEFLELLKE